MTYSPFFAAILCLAHLHFSGCAPVQSPGENPPAEESDPAPGRDDDFVGLPLDRAETLAGERNLDSRVIEVDGESRPVTMDYNPERVNFSVEKGVVLRVRRG